MSLLSSLVPGRRPAKTRPTGLGQASEIRDIYARSAALDLKHRNPVIVIPGVMGSKLVDPDNDRSVWGDFGSGSADPAVAANRRLIALPMKLGAPLDTLESNTVADGAMGVARPRRLPVEFSAYRDILQALGVGSGIPTAKHRPDYAGEGGFASFEFGYDWRRSLDETAGRLGEFVRLATHFVQSVRRNSDPVKFDVVAHSMGGLVLRYFLRYGSQRLAGDGSLPRLNWAGSEQVSRAVIIGTPNAGSVAAIDRVVHGLPTKHLVHSGFDPFIVGTMPSLYQLLPRNRHQPFRSPAGHPAPDLFNPQFWETMRWGLANPAHDDLLALQLPDLDSPGRRRETALDHLVKSLHQARILHAALDRPATPPPHLKLHLLAGDGQDTVAQVTWQRDASRIRAVRFDAGDGTVLRSSALLDERLGGEWSPKLVTPISWSSITFAASNHMNLTRDRVVIDNLLFQLFEQE